MSTDPRILLTALSALALGACFDPAVDFGDGDGSATDASTTTDPTASPTTSTTDTDTDSAEGNADSTGATDAPPVITAFTLNGSTMPEEQQTAGMLAFDVDATDDVGIARIEIYDGDQLVATVTEAPYVTEILVSSADNGSHSYSAIAYDGAAQTDESDTIPLSVNVIGGEILELREDIADAYTAAHFDLPRVATDPSGDLVVSLTNAPNIGGNTRLRALRYSSTLSLVWESYLSPFEESAIAIGHPTLTMEGELLVGGQRWDETDGNAMVLYRADAETGSPAGSLELVAGLDDVVFPVTAQLGTGDILLSIEPHILQARAADMTTTLWTQEQFPGVPDEQQVVRGIVGVDIDGAGNSLLTFTPSDAICGADGQTCIRKLSPNGTTLWTRPAAGSHDLLLTPPARFDANGRAITVWANGDQGLFAQVYDSEGMLVEDIQVLVGDSLTSMDLDIDPQGNLLVAGTLTDDITYAWAGRITPSGEVLWSRLYDELAPGDYGTLATGITVTSEGRTYVTGLSEMVAIEFFEFEAKGWLAEVML